MAKVTEALTRLNRAQEDRNEKEVGESPGVFQRTFDRIRVSAKMDLAGMSDSPFKKELENNVAELDNCKFFFFSCARLICSIQRHWSG